MTLGAGASTTEHDLHFHPPTFQPAEAGYSLFMPSAEVIVTLGQMVDGIDFVCFITAVLAALAGLFAAVCRVSLRWSIPLALIPLVIGCIAAHRARTMPAREFSVTGVTPGMIRDAEDEAQSRIFKGIFATMFVLAIMNRCRSRHPVVRIEFR